MYSEFTKDNLFPLGVLSKTHGIKGAYILRLNNLLNSENINDLEQVFINIDESPVPFFISEYSKKNSETFVVLFNEISTEEKAKEFIGCEVLIDNKYKDDLQQEEGLESFTGYLLHDTKKGEIGKIESIEGSDDNPLFLINKEGNEILIPINDDLIVEIDEKNKIILFDLPEGLIDLYL